MTNRELVQKCIDIAKNYNTLYVMGCFGAPMTGGNVARYCKNHEYNRRPARTAMIQAAADQTPPVYGFDCVNLIKGILWGWTGDTSKTYGGAKYPTTANVQAGACPDLGADTMIKVCKGVSTDFSKIVLGAAVWMEGHIGVYIGDGLAVECTPKWANKVQITAVGNIGKKAGYNTRYWTKWGKIPYITYEEESEMSEKEIKELVAAAVKEAVTNALPAAVKAAVTAEMNALNPLYKDLKDVPSYWRAVAAALLDAGAVNGGTPKEVNATDLNLRAETLKAAVIAAMYHEAREAEGGATAGVDPEADNGEGGEEA